MNNLASIVSDQGKYAQAEEMHRQALGLSKKALGKVPPSTLTSMRAIFRRLSTALKTALERSVAEHSSFWKPWRKSESSGQLVLLDNLRKAPGTASIGI
jgi:hypothetical protein